MKKNISIINYGMGNLRSVEVSLNYLGVKNKLINNANNFKFFTAV